MFETIIQLRLYRAVELLHDPGRTVAEIAYELNYKDAYYFSKQFKKFFGIAPSEYRNNYL